MTIQPPNIIIRISDNEWPFFRQLAKERGVSVQTLAGEIVSSALDKAYQAKSKKEQKRHKSVDEVLDEVRAANENGENP